MSFNLLDAVKGHFNNDLITKAASFLGEDAGGITKALSGILPATLGGFISKASSGSDGASQIMNLAKDSNSSGLLGNLGGFFSGGDMMNKGMDMLKSLLGDKASGIIDTIAGFAGIKSSSAGSLMSMAAPVAAGTIGKHAADNGLDAGGLMNMLSSQQSSIMSALPAGLSSLAGMIGLGSVGDIASKISGGVKEAVSAVHGHTDDAQERAKKGISLLPVLLIGVVAIMALLFWIRSCKSSGEHEETATPATTETTSAEPAAAESATASYKVTLPNGTELNALKGGMEDRLVAFLNTNWKSLGEDSLKKIWFDFDNLNFETGSAVLTASSQAQVDNMGAILKAFPEAKLKIGGYTDQVGNEANNKKLSGDRANAVKMALEKGGVGTQVTGAEGYGSAFAKYPADAPESDRVKDRHVSVSVRQ